MILGDSMEVTAITDLVMNDVCKNKADAFQVAFYKVDDVKKIITIIDSLDKHNCNKFRIDDFNWISRNKDNILKLPDIIIVDKSKLTPEELIVLESIMKDIENGEDKKGDYDMNKLIILENI